jgi:hypothetical protein
MLFFNMVCLTVATASRMDTSAKRIEDWLKGCNGSPPPSQEEILSTTKLVMKGLESLKSEHSSLLSGTDTDATANSKITKNQINEVRKEVLYRRGRNTRWGGAKTGTTPPFP